MATVTWAPAVRGETIFGGRGVLIPFFPMSKPRRSSTMTTLTPRYSEAVEYARAAHIAQFRKGTTIPYIYHLLGVSSLVLEYGGNEDQAIAGLLHDVLEDCGEEHEVPIRERFGDAVIAIVSDCTDGTVEAKANLDTPEAKRADWQRRKEAYLSSLVAKPDASLLVSACDKLHNARAIVSDLQGDAGIRVFDRFKAGREGTLKYYETLSRIFLRRANAENNRFHELARAFDRTVGEMHQLAGVASREPLV
jgi:(p)ppGpp synthase/HD superfamily hydrolase